MPKLTLEAKNRVLDAEQGENLMKALLRHKIPVASSCGGEGICSKCKVQVLSGKLPAPNAQEQKIIDEHKLPNDHRLACQNHVSEDLVLNTSYW